MQSLESLKKDIEFINDFTTNFFNKINALNTKTSEAMQKLNSIIEVEKNNQGFLNNLESSLTDSELTTISQNLESHLKIMNEKQKEYITLIKTNGDKIAQLSQFIREKQSVIDHITKLSNTLDSNIALFNGSQSK
jgi:arsenate reductase-like glutaredoxin family protein